MTGPTSIRDNRFSVEERKKQKTLPGLVALGRFVVCEELVMGKNLLFASQYCHLSALVVVILK